MWTPKRIVLSAVGFVVFFAGYMLYATCLGGIDGLPPLPEADMPLPPGSQETRGLTLPRGYKLEDKLRQAFGQDCPELKWALKLEMNSKNMVVAARDFTIEDDGPYQGQLKLDHISVAMFKDNKDGRLAEINTLRAAHAHLQFDKPFGKNDKEMGSRRIIAAELTDDIELVNNHRTPQRDDDMHLDIKKGPLYYDEAKHLIWTEDSVHLEDDQSKPPTEVRGQGMEIHLAAAEPPPARPEGKPAPRGKPKGETFTGVERIVLKSDVDMHLYVSGSFLSNGDDSKNKPAPQDKAVPPAAVAAPDAPAEKAQVVIYTPGRFEYEFRKDGDLARFTAPEADPKQPPDAASCVSVDRITTAADGKGPQHDQLECQQLELHLIHKDGGAKGRDADDHNMDIESAHAIALGAREVVLKSDAEKLVAHGHDFLYDAKTRLTVLKGDPQKEDSGMTADKAGNLIQARDLQILEVQGPAGKNWRQITARGPGKIDLLDEKTKKQPIHASWQEKFVSTKDGAQDLLTLTGSAVFKDDEHEQTLQADKLKVWLASPDEKATASGPANTQQARRPNHLEATGNVSAKSLEMNIHQTGQLVVWFRDVPAGTVLPGASLVAKDAGSPAVVPAPMKTTPASKETKPAAADAKPTPAAAGATADAKPAPAAKDPEPARPVDLTARSVYAWVARSEDKNALEKLQAEGDVHVHQDPANADEKGVDIKSGEHGNLLMTCRPEGNVLVVIGDLAQLLLDKIYIIGPDVTIDQGANTVVVKGDGAMQMESKSDLKGEPLSKPVPITINWHKEMFFDGRTAVFTENVQAEQDNARLACETLNVAFDRTVSLKEGNHGGPSPQVKTLVCDKNVRVEDQLMDGKRLIRSQQIISPSLAMTAIESEAVEGKTAAESQGNEIRAPGPGNIRIFQFGGGDPLAAPGARVTAAKPNPADKSAVPAAKADEVMKLTYISFGTPANHGNMYINTKTNTATFLQNVRVLNMPCDNPHIEIDLDEMLDHLPEGAMYLRGDRLDVYNRGDKTKSQQEMIAKGHVLVQAREFYGRSATMTYNEAKDQIIFEGGDAGTATLYKFKQRGGAAQKIEGKKITYIRSSGMFKIEGGEWISGE